MIAKNLASFEIYAVIREKGKNAEEYKEKVFVGFGNVDEAIEFEFGF